MSNPRAVLARLPGPRGGPRTTVLVWLLVACWGGWALVRFWGLERGFPLVPMLAFTPYVAFAVAIPIAIAAVARRWVALAAALLAAAMFIAILLPRTFSDGEALASGRGVAVSVMSANLHFGEADPLRVLELIREHEVDVLSVQELTPRSAAALRRAGLERELPHSSEEAASTAKGGGVYSRFPVISVGDPQERSGSFFMPSAVLEVPRVGAIEVVSVHPPPPTGWRSVRDWRTDLAAMPTSGGTEMRLLLGDFNATLDHDALRDVIDGGYRDAADAAGVGLTPTWSAPRVPLLPIGLPLAIDHLLVDERISVGEVRIEDLPGSDHDAVIGELVMPAAGLADRRNIRADFAHKRPL